MFGKSAKIGITDEVAAPAPAPTPSEPEKPPAPVRRQSSSVIETDHADVERNDADVITEVNQYHFVRALGRGAFAEVRRSVRTGAEKP